MKKTWWTVEWLDEKTGEFKDGGIVKATANEIEEAQASTKRMRFRPEGTDRDLCGCANCDHDCAVCLSRQLSETRKA